MLKLTKEAKQSVDDEKTHLSICETEIAFTDEVILYIVFVVEES